LKKKTPKSAWKLRVNENKWTEYTKKLMKENPHWEYMEAKDKCNSMIRTMGEDQAWQDMQCGNRILSRQYERVQMWGSIQICLQYLHTLARSPYTGVYMPVSNQF